MSRLPEMDAATFTADQKAIYDAIVSGPRGTVPGPLAVWLRRPGLATHAQALGQYCRYDSSLPARLSELAIMLLGRHWLAEYEWAVHKPFALKAGLAPEVLNAIRDGRKPDFVQRDEELVYEFVTTLHANLRIEDALYAEAISLLGEHGVIDLVGVIGYYTLISVTIKAFELPAAAGIAPELPTGR